MYSNIKLLIFIFSFSIFSIYNTCFNSFIHCSVGSYDHLIKSTNIIKKEKKQEIFIKTNVFKIKIDLYSGNINEIKLLKYQKILNKNDPIVLQAQNNHFLYQMINNIFLIENNNLSLNTLPLKFSLDKKNSFFDKKKNFLYISLIHTFKNGIVYKKVFVFDKNKYNFNIEHYVYNNSKKILKVILCGEILQTIDNSENTFNYDRNNIYENSKSCLYLNDHENVVQHSFYEIKKKNFISFVKNFSWLAMSEKYFTSVLALKNNFNKNIVYIGLLESNLAVIGYQTPKISIEPGSVYKFSNEVWTGPQLTKEMLKVAPKLDLVVNYGFFSFLSKPLFYFLSLINEIFKNWGVSIIFLTILLKILTYPFSKMQYLSSLKTQKLQPKINKIYKNNKNNYIKINKKIFSLYKKNNINPINNFLIAIIQMPIFVSIYSILTNLIELRHAPFILWINDLSNYDPYYILPILLSITVYLTQITSIDINLSRNNVYNIVSLLCSSLLSLFLIHLPSGLLIYYIFNNFFIILQQIKFQREFSS